MDEEETPKISPVEKIALNILAVLIGVVIAFTAWGALFNFVTGGSIFAPTHPMTDGGVDPVGGFVILTTLPVLFVLLLLCVIGSLWLCNKLR